MLLLHRVKLNPLGSGLQQLGSAITVPKQLFVVNVQTKAWPVFSSILFTKRILSSGIV
jgi:hypothetical protein